MFDRIFLMSFTRPCSSWQGNTTNNSSATARFYNSGGRSFQFLWVLIGMLALFLPQLGYGQSIYRTDYKRSAAISDQDGKPQNAQTWYFPAERCIDSSEIHVEVPKSQINEAMRTDPKYDLFPDGRIYKSQIQARIDTSKLNWFSNYLYQLQEPVLYNYPLKKEIYRFTCLRAFHPPIVVSIQKEGNNITLHTKVLEKMPEGRVHAVDTATSVSFRINTVRRITKADYTHYVGLLDSLKVLSTSPLGMSFLAVDGSRWILETHRPDGYYFVTRHSPAEHDPLRILGDYLLNLSDAKQEERY